MSTWAGHKMWELLNEGYVFQCTECKCSIRRGDSYEIKDSLFYCGPCANGPEALSGLSQRIGGVHEMVEITCFNCDGTGWQLYMDNGCPNQETCEWCNGSKKITVTEEMAKHLNP